VTVKTKAGKGVVSVSGGAKRPLDEDALNRVAVRQKGKASTVGSLSNAELKKHNERAKLEAEYAKYYADSAQKGKGIVKRTLTNERDSLLLQGKQGPVLKFAVGLVSAGILGAGAAKLAGGAVGKTAATAATSVATTAATTAATKAAPVVVKATAPAATAAAQRVTAYGGSVVTGKLLNSTVRVASNAAPSVARGTLSLGSLAVRTTFK
jgi:hypothetical protein